MKDFPYDDLLEEKEEKKDYHAILFKYIIRWPWFVGSILLCLLIAWLYLRYATPVYNISATIIIKDDQKGGSAGNDLSAFEDLGIVSSSKNIDNEIEILRSKSLIQNVVDELGLYIRYFAKGRINDIELYGTSPILVHYAPEDADRLASPILLTLDYQADGQLNVTGTLNGESIDKRFTTLPAVLSGEAGTITLLTNDRHPIQEGGTVEVTIQKPLAVAKSYLRGLNIEPTSKTTSVATVSLEDTDRKRGEDFINKLVEMYNRDANNDKNEVAESTARFIDERISVINRELGSTEQELESFKRQAGLTNLSSDAQLAVTEKSEYEKRRVENGTQLNLVRYLADYLEQPENAGKVLPMNVGLDDTSLSGLISEYNALVLERNRLLRTSSQANPVIRRLDDDIRSLRSSLNTTLTSVREGLLITQADLDRQANKFAGRINNAPTQERRFVSIQRQQEIKAGLYLMLLQKREENNIALAATANNAKIIDDALADDTPVSPQRQLIYLAAFLAGIAIPIIAIYLAGLFSFRIESRADVEKLTTVPIVGDIPLNEPSDSDMPSIAVRENENSVMAETFRDLRTNLLFMLGSPEQKVILITSTTSGEGKTFIASNLAISLALLGKKVILVGLDIRKPGLNRVFRLPLKRTGITQYLSAPQSTDLRSMILPSGITANLDLLPGGLVPPNPTELLARPALEEAIDQLKQTYDYIVLDTAPIGMVTDTLLIARVADASVYVCRAGFTYKTYYQLINDLQQQRRLPQLCTVINGLDMEKKKYGYGKYGKYYGYGKMYGYGEDSKAD